MIICGVCVGDYVARCVQVIKCFVYYVFKNKNLWLKAFICV